MGKCMEEVLGSPTSVCYIHLDSTHVLAPATMACLSLPSSFSSTVYVHSLWASLPSHSYSIKIYLLSFSTSSRAWFEARSLVKVILPETMMVQNGFMSYYFQETKLTFSMPSSSQNATPKGSDSWMIEISSTLAGQRESCCCWWS